MKNKNFVLYVKKNFVQTKMIKANLKYYIKLKIIVIIKEKFRGAAHSICNLRYKIPKNIPVVFHNGFTYDYNFIIKQLAKEFNGNFDCLGENTEKYITFPVPIYKKNDNDKTIIYKLNFIDSFRFMSASLSSLVDNLSEINKKECKTCMKINNIKSECRYIGFMNNRLNYECKNVTINHINQ